jgi:hypothetical protein
MLSKRLFEQLSTICFLKDGSMHCLLYLSTKPFVANNFILSFSSNGLLSSDKYLIESSENIPREYRAEDGGDVQHLSKVLAPPTHWLNKYYPVVLLRNLSDKLVNGLIGKVVSCGDDAPVVNFSLSLYNICVYLGPCI